MSNSLYEIPLKNIDGSAATLGDYAGKVLLVVNVASKCGLTPQYAGLEKLYSEKKDAGLAVLGFPANEFAGQEPGENAEIAQFCTTNYGVDFPMFEKIVVKGEGIHPLYAALTQALPEATETPEGALKQKLIDKGYYNSQPGEIMWNFEKFLIGRDGAVLARFAPDIAPDNEVLVAAVEKALAG